MAESFLTLMADYCEEDQQRIGRWYDALQRAGFQGQQTPGLPMHISLASFPLDREDEAIRLMKRVAAEFGPVQAAIRHVGVFPGGKVLFAAPDLTPELAVLQQACGDNIVHGFPWTPHTTMLIDEPESIGAALPVLMRHFEPIQARIDRLHLCAFWPTREILRVELNGKA
ncbi:MAG: 2'-5' RNA ligase family protein [Clostridiales bacterium]|nr:2'-5' RNA ligase family protein [Clostridiales bacterium]